MLIPRMKVQIASQGAYGANHSNAFASSIYFPKFVVHLIGDAGVFH